MILEFLGVWSLEEKMNREKKGWYLEKDPSRWSFARGHSILSIICNRQIHADDHLQEASHSRWSFARPGPSRWSFAKGRSIWMIICKGHVYHDNYLQEAGPSWWSFGRDYSILMIIYKRPVHPDDHLQEASPSWWSYARCRYILMIICKRLIHPDDHLQDAGTSSFSFARGRSILMILNDVLNLLSPIRCTNHNGVFVWVISERKRQEKFRQILRKDWLIRTPWIVKSNNPLSLVWSKWKSTE